MPFLKRYAGTGLISLLVGSIPALADTFHSADFSGQLGSSPNIQAPFNSVLGGDGGISGNFVSDDQLVPGPGSGFVNVFFSSFPDIADIPNATAFDLNLGGGLIFNLGNALPGDAAIQYNNGQFNGFFFISDFTFQGNPYELQLQGGVFDIVAIVGGNPTSQNLVSGTLNVGNGNLSGVAVFTPSTPPPPTVPEPASVTLLGSGLIALTLGVRKLRTRST